MASREERYHHYLWHNVRDNWNMFSPATQQQLTNLGWKPPRPSRRIDANGNLVAITDNNSGEDFLYMHRQMIKKVNDLIAQTKDPYGPVTGWKTLPAPGDKDWPVPAPYSSSINSFKTVTFYNNNIKPAEDFFNDPAQLRTMTLGELGSLLENTVHNWLHLRFSSPSSYGYRPASSGAIPQVATKWDNPKYNWLGDTYSSHVNPTFWKLHGWVDDRVAAWAKANGVTNINWKGTWEGGPMSSISGSVGINSSSRMSAKPISRGSDAIGETDSSSEQGGDMNTMDEVFKILANEKRKEMSFADKVNVGVVFPKVKAKTNLRRR